jgi:hypothetical protein
MHRRLWQLTRATTPCDFGSGLGGVEDASRCGPAASTIAALTIAVVGATTRAVARIVANVLPIRMPLSLERTPPLTRHEHTPRAAGHKVDRGRSHRSRASVAIPPGASPNHKPGTGFFHSCNPSQPATSSSPFFDSNPFCACVASAARVPSRPFRGHSPQPPSGRFTSLSPGRRWRLRLRHLRKDRRWPEPL